MVLIHGNNQKMWIFYIKTNKHYLLLRYTPAVSLFVVIIVMTDKIIEIKKKKLVNLASVMVDKYVFLDNPVLQNSEI